MYIIGRSSFSNNLRVVKKLIYFNRKKLSLEECTLLDSFLAPFQELNEVYKHRIKLEGIFAKRLRSKELLDEIKAWCNDAMDSHIVSLREFAKQFSQKLPDLSCLTA